MLAVVAPLVADLDSYTAGSRTTGTPRRRVMIIDLTLFGLASLGATHAANPIEMIVARAVMDTVEPTIAK